MKRILYIDGFNFFYSALSSNQNISDESGIPIGGVIVFLRQLLECMNRLNPSCVVIVFDGKNAGMRRRMILNTYKGRAARKDVRIITNEVGDFVNEDYQFLKLLELLQVLPVKIFQVDNYEADDVIAYLVSNNKHCNQFIASTDQDYIQLVDETTFVYSPIKKILFNKETVYSYYGVLTENYLWYKTLIGDDSDKIKGPKGIGKKNLFVLLPELKTHVFSSTSDLINYIHSLEKKSVVLGRLKTSDDLIIRNYKLMKLGPEFLSLKAIDVIKEQEQVQQQLVYSMITAQVFLIKNKYNMFFTSFDYFNRVWSTIQLKFNLNLND